MTILMSGIIDDACDDDDVDVGRGGRGSRRLNREVDCECCKLNNYVDEFGYPHQRQQQQQQQRSASTGRLDQIHSDRYLNPYDNNQKQNTFGKPIQVRFFKIFILTLAGLEPAIPRSEVWCLIHWATGPVMEIQKFYGDLYLHFVRYFGKV